MGFLQQDTNNIILDAVLTKEGRRKLAANNGTFRVTHFSLGDDEVDYSIIEKFGRAVGREKVEKNTPVFEALTNQNIESMSRLVTISNDSEAVLSTLSVQFQGSGNGDISTLTFANTISSNATAVSVTVIQSPGAGATSIPPEITDSVLVIALDNRFLSLSNARPFSTNGNESKFNVTARLVNGNPQFEFTIVPRVLTTADFNTFGNSANKTQITSMARIQGRQSGLFRDLTATLNKESAN
jgi:hypothetical protein